MPGGHARSPGTRLLLDYVKGLRPLLRSPEERQWLEAYEEAVLYFDDHHADIAREHDGKHVAILGGRVVDTDRDGMALAKRMHEAFGPRPLYMPFVGTQEPKRMGGPRPPTPSRGHSSLTELPGGAESKGDLAGEPPSKLLREHYRSAIQGASPNVWRTYVLEAEMDRHRTAARNWLRRVAKEEGKRIEFSRKKLDPNSLYFVLRSGPPTRERRRSGIVRSGGGSPHAE